MSPPTQSGTKYDHNIWRQEVRPLQIEVDGPKRSRAKNQGSSNQNEKSRRGQSAEQRESKGNCKIKRRTQLRERRLHPLERHTNTYWWKCVRDSEQTTLYKTSRKEKNVMLGMFPNVQNSKLQVDADSETSVRTHTAKPADEKKKCSNCCNSHYGEWWTTYGSTEKVQSDDKTQVRVGLANSCVEKRKNWDLPKIRENQTLQHSGNDPWNGPCAWEKWQGNQLGHCTRTANGTTHTTEEATLNFCDLNMFVEFQWRKESPAVLSRWVFCAKKSVTRMNGIQVSHHVSSRIGETSKVEATTTFSCASNRSPDPCFWRPGAETTCGWPRVKSLNRLARMAWKGLQWDRQVRQMSLQLAWKNHRQHFLLPRMLQQNLLRTEAGGKQFIHSFSEKTRIAKYADARK